MGKASVLIFDVDRTILKGSTGRFFATSAISEGVFPIYAIVLIPYYFFQYQLGNMKTVFFTRKFPLLDNISKERLDSLSYNCFVQKIKPRLYTDACELIKRAKTEGKAVVLATSSIDVIIQPLADYLGVDFLATRLELRDEISTGYFIPPAVVGPEKKNQVLSYLQRKNYETEDCAFFSDSIMDLPLLEAVGEPVAVNPDRKLKEIAEKRNWKILYFT